ncbi:MAG: DUF4013 domain-containing protein [Methanomicrobiales archaeon]|nr:DUF4013 domain-containing protein [Methanomicrobiales archaeon]
MEIEASLRDAFSYGLDGIRRKGVWVFVAVWILFQAIGLYVTKDLILQLGTADPAATNLTVAQLFGIFSSRIPLLVFSVITGFIVYLFMSGYEVRVLSGITPAPEFSGWWQMFLDGLKLTVIWIVYSLPVVLPVAVVSYIYLAPAFRMMIGVLNSTGGSFVATDADAFGHLILSWGVSLVLLLPFLLVLGILIVLFGTLGSVRFARTGTMPEAFRFGPILAHIRRLGWVSYLVALVVLFLVLLIVGGLASVVLGLPAILVIAAAGSVSPWVAPVMNSVTTVLQSLLQLYMVIVSARFIALLYESVSSDV